MIQPIIIAIVLLFLSIGLFQANKLKHIHIQKTVQINAPIENVFENVVYLENFKKWSPFLEADPTQKIEIKGTDGQIGAQYHWEGNGGKDLGYQEIKEIRSLQYVGLQCDIQKPFKANPTFEYTFSKSGNSVKVTQDFNLESSLGDAFFMWLFGARKDMAKMNARGLELLKTATEN